VGTAYRREALFKLSRAKGGRPFDPESLTEDYVIGLELRRLNCSQTLLLAPRPPADLASGRAKTTRRGHGELIATRSYFPFGVRAAIRQRARWVTGNALQSWARFGWRVGPSQWYWLWRDRKGLTVAWTSALANVLFLYGLARWLAFPDARSWSLQAWWSENTGLAAILWANLALVAWRQFARAVCAYRIYGWLHACTVPLRAPWGNAINFCATARALLTFARARVLRQPLRWAKTAHDYPRPESLAARRPVALPKAPRLPMMPGLPKMKVRLVLPGWLAIHRRLSVTLECRRVRRPAIRL
jgi:adsorption protein B